MFITGCSLIDNRHEFWSRVFFMHEFFFARVFSEISRNRKVRRFQKLARVFKMQKKHELTRASLPFSARVSVLSRVFGTSFVFLENSHEFFATFLKLTRVLQNENSTLFSRLFLAKTGTSFAHFFENWHEFCSRVFSFGTSFGHDF